MDKFSDVTILSQHDDCEKETQTMFTRTILFLDNKSGQKYRCRQIILRVTKNKKAIKPFGLAATCKDNKGCTMIGDEVFFTKPGEKEQTSQFLKEDLQIKCMNCGGEHMTYLCDKPPSEKKVEKKTDGSYVPPSMRSGYESQMVTVKVSNLPEDFDSHALKQLFLQCGRISRANVPRDKRSGACRGFGFIDFQDRKGAEMAVVKMDRHRLNYNVIDVQIAEGRDGKEVNTKIDVKRREAIEKQIRKEQAKPVEPEAYKPPTMSELRPPCEDKQPPLLAERPRSHVFERGSRVAVPSSPARSTSSGDSYKVPSSFPKRSGFGDRGSFASRVRSSPSDDGAYKPPSNSRFGDRKQRSETRDSRSRGGGFERGSALKRV